MTTSERLEALLERQGLTIASVAELAGMTKQEVWRIVRGRVKNPRIETLKTIVEAAGSTLSEFFEDEP